MSTRARIGGLAALLLAAALAAGCEESVVAVSGSELPFSMWGILNPEADTQYVRVFEVGGTLERGDPRPLDATFVSTNLVTGERLRWRDSVFVDERGVVEHLFWAVFRPTYGQTYRLEITDGSGAASVVQVAVPPRTRLTLGAPDTTRGVLLPGYVRGGPPRLNQSRLEVAMSYVEGFSGSGCPLYRFVTLTVPYDDRVRPDGDGWWFIVDLREVFALAHERADRDPAWVEAYGLILGYMRFSTVVANAEWAPPGGVFDPNVLVQPGAMENVQNGFGFVGSGYRLSAQWNLPPRIVQRSGFRVTYADC